MDTDSLMCGVNCAIIRAIRSASSDGAGVVVVVVVGFGVVVVVVVVGKTGKNSPAYKFGRA